MIQRTALSHVQCLEQSNDDENIELASHTDTLRSLSHFIPYTHRPSQYPGAFGFPPATQLCTVSVVVYTIAIAPTMHIKISRVLAIVVRATAL
jgi:hypothetical protein